MAIKYTLGTAELKEKSRNIWKSLLAEFVGIFFLNFFACSAVTEAGGDLVLIALAFGLSIFIAIMAIGHVSGCHINPAITIGLLVIGKVSLIRAVLYVIAQCLGAVAAVGTLKGLTSNFNGTSNLGHTEMSSNITNMQGLGFEFILGFVLLFVVCGVTDGFKPDSRFLAPLAIGLTVTCGHLGTVGYTGSSMNPARTFGTAIITGIWKGHWVYWVGPILGGIVASLLYTFVFEADDDEI